jgi:hypothetical protein
VDRIRKATGLPVSHVTVSRKESRGSLAEVGLPHVLVLADADADDEALLAEIRRRADRSPARFTVVVAAAVPSPAWGDEANERRRHAVEAVHRGVEDLQASGVSAQGEVMDGTVAGSAREAVNVYRPDEILVATRDASDTAAVEKASRGAVVDSITLGGRTVG